MFGNGQSSSPSNTPPPFDGPRFPRITLYDNVMCQHRLVTEVWGIKKVALVVGWSMGYVVQCGIVAWLPPGIVKVPDFALRGGLGGGVCSPLLSEKAGEEK